MQVTVLPYFKRFNCAFEKSVSSSVFPHTRQTVEDAPTFVVPSVPGELLDYMNINVIVGERKSTIDVGASVYDCPSVQK